MKDTITRYSAMQRVLSIPELLEIIFGMLDRPSNAMNAQVCKQWSYRALDVLWREVDDLHRLFSFLAPLRKSGIGSEFEELPDANRWKKFERYSLRVRRLEYDHSKFTQSRLRQSVFNDVARTRLRLDILPNMHTLAWKGLLNASVAFMHSGVQTFDIWLSKDIVVGSPQSFFQDLAIRMPNILNLDIKSNMAVLQYEADLIDLINRLPKLRTVTFPQFYTTTKIMEALSRVPNLGVIEFQYFDNQGCGDSGDVIPFTPFIEEGAFPALWDLSVSVTFEELSRFLSLKFAPTNLTSLYVDSVIIETAESIHGFLCCVADSCHLLNALFFCSSRHGDSDSNDSDGRYKITFNHLKPVLRLGNLTTLEVSHSYPLALKIEDIETLASSWPSLETLVLNNEPTHSRQSELTLAALLPFASHCPNLTFLGLFVDASRVETFPHSVTAPVVPFKRLERLSMGISIIDGDKSVALYLSHVLPLGCSVECGVTWDQEFSDETNKEVRQRCSWWEKVGNLLPVLITLRMEEKDRSRASEREMGDLRMRNDMLSDALGSDLSQVMLDNSCIVS